jgi:hypothetical protein
VPSFEVHSNFSLIPVRYLSFDLSISVSQFRRVSHPLGENTQAGYLELIGGHGKGDGRREEGGGRREEGGGECTWL